MGHFVVLEDLRSATQRRYRIVDNRLHLSPDVSFHEDASRVREPQARQTLAVLRRDEVRQ